MKTLLRSLLCVLVLVVPSMAKAQNPPNPARQGPPPPVQPAQPAQPGVRNPPPPGQPRNPPPPPDGAASGLAPDQRAGLPPDAQNVRLDFVISDTYGNSTTPTKKTVSMAVLSGQRGMIRTHNNLPLPRPSGIGGGDVNPFGGPTVPVQLNVDASARVFGEVVRVSVTFEYTPAPQQPQDATLTPHPAGLTESLTVVLRNGQPMVVSQSADPVTSRTVKVELTATITK